MPQIMETCPKCLYECPAHLFISLGNNKLKCRRCRGSFENPNAYRREAWYADTDSDRAVSRFPFALNGLNAVIRVPEGYMAYVTGAGERGFLLSSGVCNITDMPGLIQVYYICLNPRVIWGSHAKGDFGAHGTAELSLTEEYVQNSLVQNSAFVQNMESELKDLLCRHMSAYIEGELKRGGTAQLIRPAGYVAAQGLLKDGVRLLNVSPRGYRSMKQASGDIPGYDSSSDSALLQTPPPETRVASPATLEKLPNKPYTVPAGAEDVFFSAIVRPERHKAGEVIDVDMLHNVKSLVRFSAKEFDFPYGWGIYDQTALLSGTYCAHGTISLYVDSTPKLGELIIKAGSFERFAEQFFNDVLRKEIAENLRPLISRLSSRKDFTITNVNRFLSALGVDLTDALSGEGNIFGRYGLRVSRIDILNVHFDTMGT